MEKYARIVITDLDECVVPCIHTMYRSRGGGRGGRSGR
jgi:hypothetical protein